MTPKINSVRIRTGGVHYSGARIISFLTTDTSTSTSNSNTISCQHISLSPEGVRFTASPQDGGRSHLIPYSNVEVVSYAD